MVDTSDCDGGVEVVATHYETNVEPMMSGAPGDTLFEFYGIENG